VVEQTFEVMARMELVRDYDYIIHTKEIPVRGDKLTPVNDPDNPFAENVPTNAGGAGRRILSLRLGDIYDRYTKYRRDYAVSGEVLTAAQFKKQLEHSDIFIAKNEQQWLGNDNRKVWRVDFDRLASRCDVSGFEAETRRYNNAGWRP